MYPLLICFVLYWLYIAFILLVWAFRAKSDTNTPPKPIERVKTENKKPLEIEGLKYYSVHWNLQTGEVIEERGED
jgi:hypothetical protein